MSQQEKVTPVSITMPSPYAPTEKEGSRANTWARVKVRAGSLWAYLWRNRAIIFGSTAIVLALSGEWVFRTGRGATEGSTSTQVGTILMWLAVLCVLPVAWVNDTLPRLKWGRAKRPGAPSRNESGDLDLAPDLYIVPTRPVASHHTVPSRRVGSKTVVTKITPATRLRVYIEQLKRWRERLGLLGTAGGLAIVIALGATLALMVRAQFTDPLAPYIWLAMLGVLALTFAGVRPKGGAIAAMPHDPHEPVTEPRVSRVEWIVVSVVLLAAVLLRFIDLAGIPAGPYIDESGRALMARAINAGERVDGLPFSLFGTAWWGVPNLYFWLEAQSMRLFGDNLLGARVVHALAGVGTVWFTYRLGRLAWSPRVGLIAGALIAASDFAIQFSRTAGESTILIFTWVICFYYLYKGIKTQRPLDFVWGGIAGGLCLYTYASGKLLPPFLVALALFLIVRWGRKGARRFVPLLALMGLAAGLTFLPNAVFLATVKPDALTSRSNGVAIWSPLNLPGLQTQYGTDNLGVIVARQFAVTWSAFDVGQEKGPFYATNEPILPVPWAALWVLGTAYAVYRMGDVRYAGLGVWLLAGLAGAALTNDTPTLQRVAGMLPTLAILPAVFVDRVLGDGRWQLRITNYKLLGRHRLPSVVHRLPSAARNAIVVALVLLLGWQSVSFYFGTFAPRQTWLNYTLAGSYIEKLDRERDVVYMYNIPTLLGDPSPTVFLANGLPYNDYNPSEQIPVTAKRGQAVHFMTYPANSPLLPLLQTVHPGGTLTIMTGTQGLPYLSAYAVTESALEKMQYSVARYGQSTQAIERSEPRLGTLGEDETMDRAFAPPSWLSYPAPAQWSGGIIAPAYGRYLFELDAPGGALLEIDGRVLLAAPVNAGIVHVETVLARGTHTVRLEGTLESAEGRIALKWTTSGNMWPVGRRFLWGGERGSLLGTSYPSSDPSWFTLPELNPTDVAPSMIRRDGFLSWLSVNRPLAGGTYVFARWQGTLGIPVAGDYSFMPETDGSIALWIDGKPVGAQGVVGIVGGLPVTLHLEAGPHPFELRFQANRDNARLQLLWQRPGRQPELMSPSAFAPAEGGAWLTPEMPGAPGVDPALVVP